MNITRLSLIYDVLNRKQNIITKFNALSAFKMADDLRISLTYCGESSREDAASIRVQWSSFRGSIPSPANPNRDAQWKCACSRQPWEKPSVFPWAPWNKHERTNEWQTNLRLQIRCVCMYVCDGENKNNYL